MIGPQPVLPVLLEKVKRPGGVFTFEAITVGEDSEGHWLLIARGSRWTAPHDAGRMPWSTLVLLDVGRPWVTWWVDDPHDRRVECDVCLPPERTAQGWSFVDLELDPVLHVDTGVSEVEDRDEFAQAVRGGFIDAGAAELAEATAHRLDAELRGEPPPAWLQRGWSLLRSTREHPPV